MNHLLTEFLCVPLFLNPSLSLLFTGRVNSGLGHLVSLLAQQNDEGKEVACYYLSRMMVGAELHYEPIEKLCLALIFALKKQTSALYVGSADQIDRTG